MLSTTSTTIQRPSNKHYNTSLRTSQTIQRLFKKKPCLIILLPKNTRESLEDLKTLNFNIFQPLKVQSKIPLSKHPLRPPSLECRPALRPSGPSGPSLLWKARILIESLPNDPTICEVTRMFQVTWCANATLDLNLSMHTQAMRGSRWHQAKASKLDRPLQTKAPSETRMPSVCCRDRGMAGSQKQRKVWRRRIEASHLYSICHAWFVCATEDRSQCIAGL